MNNSFRHIGLVVPDLKAAEEYYQLIFGMKLIGREAELDDGLWYSLPFDKNWTDAHAAGIEIGMVALRNDEIVLALFAGIAPLGQVFAIGLNMSQDEIAGVRSRLLADADVIADQIDFLEFRDPYQIIWQISAPGSEFLTAGEFADRWVEI